MNNGTMNQLQQDFRGDLLTDESSLDEMSIDASIFQVMPSVVAVPKDAEDLRVLVKNTRAMQQNGVDISLTPRAAGTCMSGGSLTQHVIVDMKPGFNWVDEVDAKKKTVWVGAGTYHRDLEKVAAKDDLLFAPYTSSKDLCVIGGMIGNNASGEKSIRYGATVDNVMAIRMVCSDGNEYEFGSISVQESLDASDAGL